MVTESDRTCHEQWHPRIHGEEGALLLQRTSPTLALALLSFQLTPGGGQPWAGPLPCLGRRLSLWETGLPPWPYKGAKRCGHAARPAKGSADVPCWQGPRWMPGPISRGLPVLWGITDTPADLHTLPTGLRASMAGGSPVWQRPGCCIPGGNPGWR